MERRANVIIRYSTPAPYRKLIEVIDSETGDILLSKREDDISGAFAAGEKFATAELTIVRDISDVGEVRTVRYGEDIICGGWKDRGTRRRGGNKSYVKLYPSRLNDLSDRLKLALVKLTPYVRVDGYINNSRGKRKALKSEEIFAIWGVSHSTGYEMLSQLGGVIEKTDEGFRLDKKLIGRG